MLRLSRRDLYGSLERCYQLMAGVVREKSGDDFGGGWKPSGQLSCQLNMALASKVIGYIDNRLPEGAAEYYRWVFGGDINGGDVLCFRLANYSWAETEELLKGRRLSVRDGLSALRVCVPYEVRYRVHNRGRSNYSVSTLSQVLGVAESSFKRSYQETWESMVRAVLLLGEAHDRPLEEFLELLLNEELVEDSDEDRSKKIASAKGFAKRRREDFKSADQSAPRVNHVGGNVTIDEEVTAEDVNAYLARGGVIQVVDEKNQKKGLTKLPRQK
ncbi:hypothetical protein HBA55_34960 [Pseudomaricurvus alkylphenolicus]|uniref:hypothetical protein n=1 Tax=Pseudomaricurvus alkylphenolicus TaxID=1306991 RepID=UPI001424737E|nr:hypothetical protein [Pseudomaricurvus alkylphenolicus]NIB44834.1 hypothetical protein [Pseudomaricurvus alkylphenolicus]